VVAKHAIPKNHALAKAEFAALRTRLVKVGTRVCETAHRFRITFAAACPDAALFPRPGHCPQDCASMRSGAQPYQFNAYRLFARRRRASAVPSDSSNRGVIKFKLDDPSSMAHRQLGGFDSRDLANGGSELAVVLAGPYGGSAWRRPQVKKRKFENEF